MGILQQNYKTKCHKFTNYSFRKVKTATPIRYPTTFQNTFYFDSLPKIPKCYSKLEDLLTEFKKTPRMNEISDQCTEKKKNKAQKKPTKRKLNGFIAYRSYYSKNIHDTALQIEVSKRLATVWKDDPSADIWKRFAFEYNKSDENMPFLEWLDVKTSQMDKVNKQATNGCDFFLDFEVLNFICDIEGKYVVS